MKKKTIKIAASVISILFIGLGSYTLYFFNSTQDKKIVTENLEDYKYINNMLSENTDDFSNNLFLISNPESNDSAGFKIYEGQRFLFTDLCRYSNYFGTEISEPTGCGTANFTLKNNNGEEKNVAVLFADGRKDVARIEYDITTNMSTETISKKIKNTPFIFIAENKGQESVNAFSCISGARFYDKDNNLIYDTNKK